MKKLTVLDSEKNLIFEDLIGLEKILQLSLPVPYKEFLLLHNGGHPEKDFYPLINSYLKYADISWFYAFYEGEYENLLKEIQRHKNTIPRNFIPIGRSSGSEICLGISGVDLGRLYLFIPSDGYDENGMPFPNDMYLISNDFTDFINSLYKSDLDINKDGEEIWTYTHDKYSIGFSREAKKYGSIVTDFFAKAPDEVEDYIIEEKEDCEDRLLYYNVPEEGKRYNRLIKSNGEVNDYVSDIEEGREN